MENQSYEDQLFHLHQTIMEIARFARRGLHPKIESVGFSMDLFRVLKQFRDKVQLDINILTQEIHMKKGNLSRTIKQLIKLGYVVRGTDPADRRKGFIKLTEKGKDALKLASQQEHEFVLFFYRMIPKDRISEFLDVFQEFETYIRPEETDHAKY